MVERSQRGSRLPPLPEGNNMSHAAPHTPDAGGIVMYSTTTCGYCRRLKKQLESTDIVVTEINIEEHPETVNYIEAVNGGNQTVPTVVFADGTAATNPSLAEVKERVAAA